SPLLIMSNGRSLKRSDRHH
ncbi:hypothetical protein D046_2004C, partial [Vibrio parahaemolyticus V-223/04]